MRPAVCNTNVARLLVLHLTDAALNALRSPLRHPASMRMLQCVMGPLEIGKAVVCVVYA